MESVALTNTSDIVDGLVRGFMGTVLWILFGLFGRRSMRKSLGLYNIVSNWFGQSLFQWMITKLSRWSNWDDWLRGQLDGMVGGGKSEAPKKPTE